MAYYLVNRMNVIFLGIDGVLNSGRSFLALSAFIPLHDESAPYQLRAAIATIDPIAVSLLNRVIKEFDAKIVLSSSHRIDFVSHGKLVGETDEQVFENIKEYLGKLGVNTDTFIGYTPQMNGIRGEDIAAWFETYERAADVENYVILDDAADFLEHQLERLVQCPGDIGITEKNYFEMTTLFGRSYSGILLP